MASFKGQKTLTDFDVKQKILEDYVEWEDPDDEGDSYESCYRLNRVV